MRTQVLSQFNINDFTRGIITNAATADVASKSAYDIVNFVQGRYGELKKIPIGVYLAGLPTTIKRIVRHAERSSTQLLLSLDDGTLHRYIEGSTAAFTFPSQVPMIGTGATAQSTVIKDYFTFGDVTFLLTGTPVNWRYTDDKGLQLYGQKGIIAPCTAATATDYASSTPYSIGDAVLPDNGYSYIATVDGTSGASPPTWPTTIGDTVVDGTVTWRCDSVIGNTKKATGVKYRVTWWDGVCESNPSPDPIASDDSTKGVFTVGVATGSSNIEQIRVYRYDSDTATWRFIKGLDKTRRTISDDSIYYFTDASDVIDYGDILEEDNFPPPPCTIGETFKSFAFLAGSKKYPATLFYSKIDNVYSFPAGNYVTIGTDDDAIVATVAIADALLILKERSLWKLTGYSEDTFSVSFVSQVGCVSKLSPVAIMDVVYWVGDKGAYSTDGITTRRVSDNITQIFDGQTNETLKECVGMYAPLVDSIYWGVRQEWTTDGGWSLILNMKTGAFTRTTMGITDSVNDDGTTYFALDNDFYVLSDNPYKTVESTLITQLYPLTDSVDTAVIRRVSVAAGNGEAGTDLYLYYRTTEDDDWTLLDIFTFSSSQQTFRISTDIRSNYIQFKVSHTGRLDRFYGISVEYRTLRNKDLEVS